ncbi:MAG: response regulator [Methanosarcinaceae archaeon]|nr:response regulator [Methanosarcinaceae archaeon]MDD4748979.1 response regulator [Methanosarcinaceae archaeon]
MIKNEIPKVLIVDDMPQNVELMEAFLAKEPYELLQASNGKEALRKVKAEDPDIVLLDVMMPEMDGFEVCEILKNDGETQFTPVLMLTALSELNDRIKGIEVGADDFLTKPINGIELRTRVKSLLRVKCLHDRLMAEKNAL